MIEVIVTSLIGLESNQIQWKNDGYGDYLVIVRCAMVEIEESIHILVQSVKTTSLEKGSVAASYDNPSLSLAAIPTIALVYYIS